ncbi:MAG: type II toxin-antitoxin system prevent-host-death family antitoxin [Gemmatimonadetes bacterium]|nr:type II toxin-antitoxin system prevent-host-death family antitoxin [Gemmatimonadota bacterium]
MRAVGVRELKNRLSEYLRVVRGGEHVLVTDRGRVIAEIRPPGLYADQGVPAGLAQLVREGAAHMGLPNDASAYPSLPRSAPDGTGARLLSDLRGDG